MSYLHHRIVFCASNLYLQSIANYPLFLLFFYTAKHLCQRPSTLLATLYGLTPDKYSSTFAPSRSKDWPYLSLRTGYSVSNLPSRVHHLPFPPSHMCSSSASGIYLSDSHLATHYVFYLPKPIPISSRCDRSKPLTCPKATLPTLSGVSSLINSLSRHISRHTLFSSTSPWSLSTSTTTSPHRQPRLNHHPPRLLYFLQQSP